MGLVFATGQKSRKYEGLVVAYGKSFTHVVHFLGSKKATTEKGIVSIQSGWRHTQNISIVNLEWAFFNWKEKEKKERKPLRWKTRLTHHMWEQNAQR